MRTNVSSVPCILSSLGESNDVTPSVVVGLDGLTDESPPLGLGVLDPDLLADGDGLEGRGGLVKPDLSLVTGFGPCLLSIVMVDGDHG